MKTLTLLVLLSVSCAGPHQRPDEELPAPLVVECLAGEERCLVPDAAVSELGDPNLVLGQQPEASILICVGDMESPGVYIQIGGNGFPVCVVETDGSAEEVTQGVLWCAYGLGEVEALTCIDPGAFCEEVSDALDLGWGHSNLFLNPSSIPGSYTRLNHLGEPICNAATGGTAEEAVQATQWCIEGLL
jgi:hypothetical protein